MSTTEDTPDMITALRHDHRSVEELFKKVQDHARFRNRRRELADQVIIELVRHMAAEEQHVYPIVRDAADGQSVVDHALTANAAAEALMKQLERLEPTDEVFDRVLIKLMAVTRSHVADEEAQLFPCLAAACLPTELRELGEKVQAGRSIRPTRPYPSAPTVAPGDLLVGSVLGLVDRVRDALAHGPRCPTGRVATGSDWHPSTVPCRSHGPASAVCHWIPVIAPAARGRKRAQPVRKPDRFQAYSHSRPK
jgi:hemerythrin superfamily protein